MSDVSISYRFVLTISAYFPILIKLILSSLKKLKIVPFELDNVSILPLKVGIVSGRKITGFKHDVERV